MSEKIEADVIKKHLDTIQALHTQINQMNSHILVVTAERDAATQTVNEIVMNNVKLRAGTLLHEKQGQEFQTQLGHKDAIINSLHQKIAASEKAVAEAGNPKAPKK